MLIHGQCHCGNIRFSLTWEPEPAEIPARACDCTFCRKHSGLWTGTPDGALQVRVDDASQVSRYTFGTHSAQFLVCARCGVVPVVLSEIEGQLHAVVSVHAMDDVDATRLRRSAASFAREDKEERVARRKRNWIARVDYQEGNHQGGTTQAAT